MKWSPNIGKVAGVEVHVHFTFVLLLVFLGFVYRQNTQAVGLFAAPYLSFERGR